MTDLPSSRISDEEVRALAFVIAKAIPRITHRDKDGAQTFYADLFAQMLAEAGWRREADVLREAADTLEARYPTDVWHPASTSPDAMAAKGVRVACGQLRHLAAERDRATALEPAQPLPVADGSEAHCATGSCRGNPVIVLGGDFRCARCAGVILVRSGSRG